MVMSLAKPKTSLGPGYLLRALLGTPEPSSTVAGSVFTDAWPVGWVMLGATNEGHVWNYQITTEPIEAAEFLDPLGYETEGRAGRLETALVSITASNVASAYNGASMTTSGSGATLKTVVEPSEPGAEVRCMIGWESRDATERYILRQCFQGGEVAINRGKGAGNKATIPLSYMIEVPDTGLKPFAHIFAGTRAV